MTGDAPSGGPSVLRGMAVTGGGVLLVSMVAFFRVPLLPSIGRDLGMSAADLGVLTTFFALGRLATDLPAGRLADRLSAAGSLSIAGGALGAGSLGLALAGGTSSAWAAAFVLGISTSLTNTTGMTYFSEAVPLSRRATSLSVFSAALLGGQALGPMLGGFIASFGDWRTAQVAGAVVGAGLVVAPLAWRPLRLLTARRRPPPVEDRPARNVPAIPPLERLVLYSVPFTVFLSLGSLPQTLVPVIGAQSLGLSPTAIGLALGLGGLMRFVGAVLGGQVADRLSRRAALIPSLAFQGAGIALLALPQTLWLWVAAIVVMSVASYGISTAAAILADLAGGAGVGRLLGTFRFVGDLGLIIGPAATAWLFEHAGRAPAVLTVAGLLWACAAGVAMVLPETRWLSGGGRPGAAEGSPPG